MTICTHKWTQLFGQVLDGKMILNSLGRVIKEEWLQTAEMRPSVRLDEYAIMPNHVHGVIIITHHGRGTMHRAPTKERFGYPVSGSIPTIIRGFKSACTQRINKMRRTPGVRVWQRNYYEHIIGNDAALNRIREYIATNPQRWNLDRYHPDASGGDEFDRLVKNR